MPTEVQSHQTASESTVKKSRPSISLGTLLLLATNVLLLTAVGVLLWRQNYGINSEIQPYPQPEAQINSAVPTVPTDSIGKRHQLSYRQWLDILKQEADVAANKRPSKLAIMVGDSLSLWFPNDLLPQESTWLNQAISGERSDGLLKRLQFFADTQPQTIWVMIGINDLINQKSDREIFNNYQKIITNLRKAHPQSQLIIQSILPHSGEAATWEGRDKLLAVPNSRIRKLNNQIRDFATKNNASFLDLYPLFRDSQGNLKPEFSTDGLHLNREGYLTWRSAIILHLQSN